MKRNDIASILNDNIVGRVVPCRESETFKPTISVYMQCGDISIEFLTADTHRASGFHYYKSFRLVLICRDGSLYVRNQRRLYTHPLSVMTPIDRNGTVQVVANSLCVNYRTVKRWFRRAQHYPCFRPIILHVIK